MNICNPDVNEARLSIITKTTNAELRRLRGKQETIFRDMSWDRIAKGVDSGRLKTPRGSPTDIRV